MTLQDESCSTPPLRKNPQREECYIDLSLKEKEEGKKQSSEQCRASFTAPGPGTRDPPAPCQDLCRFIGNKGMSKVTHAGALHSLHRSALAPNICGHVCREVADTTTHVGGIPVT